MKRIAVFAAVLAWLAAPAEAQQLREFEERLVPSITVTGEGEVQAAPDQVQLLVGVVTEAESAAEAVEKNSEAMAQLMEVLRRRGIEERNIRTTAFNVAPQYRYDREGQRPPRIIAYRVTNQVQIKTADLDALGPLLDELVRYGANQIQGIHFTLEDDAEMLQQARRHAFDDARQRAEFYAQAAGVGLGQVLLIREETAAMPRPILFERRLHAAVDAERAVPIAPGEETVRVTVNVTFSLPTPTEISRAPVGNRRSL